MSIRLDPSSGTRTWTNSSTSEKLALAHPLDPAIVPGAPDLAARRNRFSGEAKPVKRFRVASRAGPASLSSHAPGSCNNALGPMSENLRTVLSSVVEVFGVVAIAWFYARRLRPDLASTLRLGMHVFIPCLAFSAIIDSRIEARELVAVVVATLIQIGSGLLIGWIGLRALGWRDRRELLLPIAFVNSANLPFPLLLANFGTEGLSLGVLSYTVTNLAIFTVGILILHGGGRSREALREPALWATILAVALRVFHVEPPDVVMRVPRLAGAAGVPVMLFLFGDSLSRARLTSARPAAGALVLRYASGAVGLTVTLLLLRPEGLLRKVLVLYALLPAAMVNVVLAQKAGRDAESVSSAVLLTTLAAVVILPLVLAFVR